MTIAELCAALDREQVGQEMHDLIAELYPICRSITGNGVRATLEILRQRIPLDVHEVPSGTRAFDWTVPKEWNIRDAYVKNERGERVIDFQRHNLHVLNYSAPIHTRMSLAELRPHLFSLPEQPDLIPYRTSYYNESWGFCLSHRQLQALPEESYEICIDSTLEAGSLTYGEYYLPGASSDEVLISCHTCHPSLCNDNLSGISLAVALAQQLAQAERRYSYRFLFIPGTIGSITWLSRNTAIVPRIKHGLVVVGVGDPGASTYKRSRRGDAEIDQAMSHVLKHAGQPYEILDFYPYGYDERQYCSPGFNLPVGVIMRSQHGRFPEYHTSADNLDLVRPAYLADSLAKVMRAVQLLERNRRCQNQSPQCEPQLGKRGLYQAIGGQMDAQSYQMAMLWVLNLSDGQHSLLDIAERAGMPFETIAYAAERLLATDLLKEAL